MTLRNSWLLSFLWIKTPEHINREALKRAWETRWKNPNTTSPKEMALTINPSWLNVEKAIIFLRSHSKIAIIPAKIKVVTDIKNIIFLYTWNKEKNRIIKNTPAVTKVEECTKEETGVGAAIAAGNQEEKGTWALFVLKAKNINKNKKYKDIFSS